MRATFARTSAGVVPHVPNVSNQGRTIFTFSRDTALLLQAEVGEGAGGGLVFEPLDANCLSIAQCPDVPLGSGQGHLTKTATRMKHYVNEHVIPTCSVRKRLVAEALKHVGSALHR